MEISTASACEWVNFPRVSHLLTAYWKLSFDELQIEGKGEFPTAIVAGSLL